MHCHKRASVSSISFHMAHEDRLDAVRFDCICKRGREEWMMSVNDIRFQIRNVRTHHQTVLKIIFNFIYLFKSLLEYKLYYPYI